MPRTAPERVSWGVYWRRKLDTAQTPLARFAEASDFFRSAARRCKDQETAVATLEREAARLEELARQLAGRRPNR